MAGKIDQKSDLKEQLKKMQQLTKKVTASKTSSQNYLIKTGIYTKTGHLKTAFNK